ncbi:MAG: methionyl-tRNA formyltransferase [Anaerolineales bacterium]|nr:methionyl-tRNA formyltransferase [Anaerolineales bacterium]
MTRIVFMGTPAFAVPSLQALLAHYPVAGVVTQPDGTAKRGRALIPTPVKEAALAAGVPVIQPHRLREPEAMAQLAAWAPDLIVVAAFGQILRPAVLDLPAHGCVNVHASLLPRHRGAAPVAAAILAGDAVTGVTIMRMDAGLDTGPRLHTSPPVRIEPDDTTETLTTRLAAVGATTLLAALPDYVAGRLRPEPQDEAQSTYAPQLKKGDGRLDFTRPAAELERRVRAMTPWPGAYALWPEAGAEDRVLKITRAALTEDDAPPPGVVAGRGSEIVVGCGAGALRLIEVQPPGKRAMPAADFARGARDFIGARLA